MRPDSSPRWKAAMAALHVAAIGVGVAFGAWAFVTFSG
jgi:hypothetical protein